MSGPETGPGTVTYRGRSLEEVLPKIREELGPDAIIERHRTGLVGGVGGFFQREMVEVDARPASPRGPAGLDVLAGAGDDADVRAAAAPPAPGRADVDEGLRSPAMRQIVQQSEPFADLLAGAESDAVEDDAEEAWAGWDDDLRTQAAEGARHGEEEHPPPPARFAGGHGSVSAAAAYRGAASAAGPAGAPTPAAESGAAQVAAVPAAPPAAAMPSAPAPAPPADAASPATQPAQAGGRRSAAADAQVRALVDHGLSPALASDVVAEAISHAMPFAPARGGLKRQTRAMLARRIPVQSGFGGAGRTIALVGTAGSGKTRVTAGLAAAYAAASDLPVLCFALRPRDAGGELSALLHPAGVRVQPVEAGATLRAQVGARAGDGLVVIDTPAVSPRDEEGVARLAADLRDAEVTEVHVVVPATVAGPVAAQALHAFAPLAPAALVITHADETDHLGPLVDLAVAEGRPLSYVASGTALGGDLVPADPAALAARLLP